MEQSTGTLSAEPALAHRGARPGGHRPEVSKAEPRDAVGPRTPLQVYAAGLIAG